jgi:hypothetical protein
MYWSLTFIFSGILFNGGGCQTKDRQVETVKSQGPSDSIKKSSSFSQQETLPRKHSQKRTRPGNYRQRSITSRRSFNRKKRRLVNGKRKGSVNGSDEVKLKGESEEDIPVTESIVPDASSENEEFLDSRGSSDIEETESQLDLNSVKIADTANSLPTKSNKDSSMVNLYKIVEDTTAIVEPPEKILDVIVTETSQTPDKAGADQDVSVMNTAHIHIGTDPLLDVKNDKSKSNIWKSAKKTLTRIKHAFTQGKKNKHE